MAAPNKRRVLSMLEHRWTRPVTPHKNGVSIKISGRTLSYGQHEPALIDLVGSGRRVHVTYNPTDTGSVRVYDERFALLCEAPLNTRHGGAPATAVSRADLQSAIARQRQHKRDTKRRVDSRACRDRHGFTNGGGRGRNKDGTKKPTKVVMRVAAGKGPTGEQLPNHSKPFPTRANPGNVIRCMVGGGKMGHALAHENEAPFPLTLAERFVLSFCPPGGTVLDPFAGSGTTGHAAVVNGRRFIGIDVRASQIGLTKRRLDSLAPASAAEAAL